MSAPVGPSRLLLERARNSRALGAALFVAGLYLLVLPLVFAVFLRETEAAPLWLRIVLAVVWFLAALLIGATALLRELAAIAQHADELIKRRRRAGRRRELAALTSIAALLRPGATGLPDSFRFAAFVPERDGSLRPVLEPEPQPWRRWLPGHGVVGVAWGEQGLFIEAVAEQTLDPEFKLTSEQRSHYGNLTYVAGRAIFGEDGRVVGVLSVSCDDGSDFHDAGGIERFRLLASDMGILVGDARSGGE